MIDIFGESVNTELVDEETYKRQKVSLFDWLNDLNYEKKRLFSEETEQDFSAFMINRGMSQNVDTVMFANEMNKNCRGTKQMVYDFYYYIVTKKKRFGKWSKRDSVNDDNVKLVMEHYQVNRVRALEYLRLLSSEEVIKIKSMYEVGGRKK